MTVQELKYYLEHLPGNREVQVYGGGMNTITAIVQIATNHQDIRPPKSSSVLLIVGGGTLPPPPNFPRPALPEPTSIIARILCRLIGDD